MRKYKIILVDSDVISHFISAKCIDKLAEIVSPNFIYILDVVYREVTRCGRKRKELVDSWMKQQKMRPIPFHYDNEKVRMEYFRIKKENGLIGDGERACMAMARFQNEVLASSNFKDIKDYCNENGIEYIGCMDLLYIAQKRKIFTTEQCNSFISSVKELNNARLPVAKIEDYIPDRDLSYYIN